ncbi:hypothetical protein SUNI508_12614 [Seiridium unicorne]|uniref:Uncharacterized protein n=1 Tax=Seiridium unicorne TaxID=138068 RepID=A0ABR2VGL3_9PEZI
MTEAAQQRSQAMKFQELVTHWKLVELLNSPSQPFYDSRLAWLLLNQGAQQSPLDCRSLLPVTDQDKSHKQTEPIRNEDIKSVSAINKLYARALDMDLIWNGYRRQPNKGTITIFRHLRPNVEELARKMYGEDNIVGVRFGKHKDTAYILIFLAKEPEGAEGPASDEFMALSANFYEVLKDGQAGEAAVIANALAPELVQRDGLAGLGLVDLFEIQVNHPISGRLLVGPIEKQRRFVGI